MSAFVLAALAALMWGTSTLAEKAALLRADPLAGVIPRSLGVALGAGLLALFIPQLSSKLTDMGWKSFVLLMGGGLFASVLGQTFFYRALKMGEVSRVAPIGGAWPLVAFVGSLLVFQEPLTLKKLAGVLLIVAGGALLK